MDLKSAQERIKSAADNISKVVVGKEDVILKILSALCAGGHVLLEDVPGAGKTVLAKSLAKSLGAAFSRIQFTPDLLPSDVTGLSIYNRKTEEFVFSPGPVFCNILLADEINRATPRTQSGLLECMELCAGWRSRFSLLPPKIRWKRRAHFPCPRLSLTVF